MPFDRVRESVALDDLGLLSLRFQCSRMKFGDTDNVDLGLEREAGDVAGRSVGLA